MCYFFYKQKTAYEMRISDWSSDVCSSDLLAKAHIDAPLDGQADAVARRAEIVAERGNQSEGHRDRKSVVSGKSVSERVDLGGSRIIQKNTKRRTCEDKTKNRKGRRGERLMKINENDD